jgi:putative Ca2+/H+ antiporter (TMEM165/GDT1 family)
VQTEITESKWIFPVIVGTGIGLIVLTGILVYGGKAIKKKLLSLIRKHRKKMLPSSVNR